MPWDTSDADAKDKRLLHAVVDMTAPMGEAERIVAEAIDKNFATESAAGEAWAPLAPRTMQDRVRQGYPADHPILERTKRLRASMKGRHDRESAEVGPSEDVAYAAAQNCGTDDGRIPARPFLVIAHEDADKIEHAIVEHIERSGS